MVRSYLLDLTVLLELVTQAFLLNRCIYISLVTPKTNSSNSSFLLSFQCSAANDWNKLQKPLKLETLISLTSFKHQLSEQLTDYCTCTQPIYNLAQTTISSPTVFCSFAPHYLYLHLAHSSTANLPFQCFTCYIVFTSPPWPFFCLYLPYLTPFAHIVYRLIFLLYY